jgi:uncharacterized protein (TIGR03086 family)
MNVGTVEGMTNTADEYRTNAADFNARVEAVPADAWENQSPCADWKARDVVRHVVDTSGMFLGFIDQKLPPAPSVDEDPVAAWHSARDTIQAALDDPATASKEYDGFAGKSTFEQGVQKFLGADLIVHTWDLARATGGDETIDPKKAEAMLESLEPMDKMMRQPGAFDEKIDPPQADDPATRLLNFVGRKV